MVCSRGGGGKGHGTRKLVANISSKQFESKAVLNVLMNFDDGPQKKAIHKRGVGEEILSTFPRKELVTQLTGMQLECGGRGGEGR